ncbi:hypothetical protein BD309DRAFT_511948 [Dichomitus squalens]|nr:hypothetical protein BD309DRAFT_511948 [Dichomitus squalens]
MFARAAHRAPLDTAVRRPRGPPLAIAYNNRSNTLCTTSTARSLAFSSKYTALCLRLWSNACSCQHDIDGECQSKKATASGTRKQADRNHSKYSLQFSHAASLTIRASRTLECLRSLGRPFLHRLSRPHLLAFVSKALLIPMDLRVMRVRSL